jgi:hypothetical protein
MVNTHALLNTVSKPCNLWLTELWLTVLSIFRRYFNPEVYNIVQLDQRGCGKSLPHAELEDNNTQVANIYTTVQI